MMQITNLVALGNHGLLCQEDFFRGNLNAKISTSNHDTIRSCDDLVQVVDTLVVLNLRDDEDLLALITC